MSSQEFRLSQVESTKSRDESAWLLERGSAGSPEYATIKDGTLSWTIPGDHASAIRFSRRADAEAMATIMEDADRIAEHMWHDLTPSAAVVTTKPTQTNGLHPSTDDLVDRFAAALKAKLLKAQDKYGYSDEWSRSGWMDECRRQLAAHVIKGDPRDAAAYCAFLWHHGEFTQS